MAKYWWLVLVALLLSACVSQGQQKITQRFGPADPHRYDTPAPPRPGDVSYSDIQRILNSRCVVCHSCYDAPCQLKLTAWDGIARGASKQQVYDGSRLRSQAPTRLFEDALDAASWRQKGFYPVLNEQAEQAHGNLDASVLARLLMLKQDNPLPAGPILPDSFDFSLSRQQQCPRIDEFDRYAKDYPQWGMPFGLPALSEQETSQLLRWLQQGAPKAPDPALPADIQRQIAQWETFLNGDSLKSQLTARYLYEHLFLAHLYFGDDGRFFKLVRSRTAPGLPVSPIATRRPFDDPGVARPYYRLVPERETPVSKTHMPYRLDAARLSLWTKLFVDAPYTVTTLPGYEPAIASNPFRTFEAIPVRSRYRFMLQEAQFTVMGFIKGPVCRGQQALNVINDHFWVFFLDPELPGSDSDGHFLSVNSDQLQLPAASSGAGVVSQLLRWKTYAEAQKHYLAAKSDYAAQRLRTIPRIGAEQLWNGDGTNRNAALTVFRHFDSASVVQGLVGDKPQTVWVLSYPLLERIHYLLVAGYDVFSNVGEQLDTRLYMDFLRIEGEQNFLTALPAPARTAIEARWYRDAPDSVKAYVEASHLPAPSRVTARLSGLPPDAAEAALLTQFHHRLAPVLDKRYELKRVRDPLTRRGLQALDRVHGSALAWLPQTVMIKVTPRQGEPVWVSLLNNSAYSNVASIFGEAERRLPAEDDLTVAYGFLGAYPNAFWDVKSDELPALAQAIAGLKQEADYTRLMDRFGMRRTQPNFWAFSDEALREMQRQQGLEYGLLDYNRLENR